jgi:hypothetical protein
MKAKGKVGQPTVAAEAVGSVADPTFKHRGKDGGIRNKL